MYRASLTLLLLCGVVTTASGQTIPSHAPLGAPQTTTSDKACTDCTVRHPLLAIGEVFGMVGTYNLVDRALPLAMPEHYQVSPRSWQANLRHPLIWDADAFEIDEFGHPYQGGSYFSAGRSLGLSYWQTAPLTLLGSATWEWFGETTTPAWNDLINSSVGGILFGEVVHRLGWLVRDQPASGASRAIRDVVATAIDPVNAINQQLPWGFRAADASSHQRPTRVTGRVSAGYRWRDTGEGTGPGTPWLEVHLTYGQLERGPAREPFDAFTMAFRIAHDEMPAMVSVRGRLLARALATDHQFIVVQGYDFENQAVRFGSQSVLGGLADRLALTARTTLATTVLAGVLPLAGVDTATATGTRRDYGPGAAFHAAADLDRDGVALVRLSYGTSWMHSVNADAATHHLHALRADAFVPLWRHLRLGIGGDRMTLATTLAAGPTASRTVLQARTYLAWVFR